MTTHPVRPSYAPIKASAGSAIKPSEPMRFTDLVSAYEQRLLHAALQILRSESAALQATESAFVRAYQRLESPFSTHPTLVWMFRFLVHACLEQIRDQQPEHHTGESACEQDGAALSSAPTGPAVVDNGVVTRMDIAISQLGARRRIVFVLAHYEGLTFEQIGDVVDISTHCARVTYHAAILELCSKLGNDAVAELKRSLQPLGAVQD